MEEGGAISLPPPLCVVFGVRVMWAGLEELIGLVDELM